MVGIALVSGILCLGVIASLVEQAEREVDAVDAVQQETVTLPDPRPIEADLVASYGGQSRGLAATASALYLAQGKRIESADLTDADHPRFNSTLAFTESVTALGLIHGYLLAGVGRRLVVLGLSDPLRPQPLVQIELARVAQKLTIDSSLARVYVLGQTPPGVSLDVDVIDLAEPRAPRHLGSMGLWLARDLAAGNGALYVTTRTDPGQVLAFDARGTALPVASPWSDVQRDVSQVTILDGRLYARISPVKGPEQLVTYDVSQPLQPQLLEQRVLTSQPMQQWVGHRGRLYGTVMQDSRGLESTLLSLDVDSRQGTPALTGRARFYGELQALIALDDHLFGVTNGCGLKVFRVPTEGRGAEAMVEVPVSETVPIAGSIAQVASEGNGVWAAGYAYQTCNRVDRLDLSIPMQPHRRSIIPLRGPFYSLELTSDSLAAGVGLWFGSPPLLHLWPRNGPNDEPPKVLTAEYPAQLLAYDKRRDHLYVAARHVGWRDPAPVGLVTASGDIRRLESVPDMETIAGMAVQDGKLAMVSMEPKDRWPSIRLYDLTGKRALGHVRVGTTPLSDQRYAVALAWPALYVAGEDLKVFELSQDGIPRLTQQITPLLGYDPSIDMHAGRVALTAQDGVVVFDASNPMALRPLTRWRIDNPADVSVVGRFVFVAARSDGLLVLRIPEADGPSASHLYLPFIAQPRKQ